MSQSLSVKTCFDEGLSYFRSYPGLSVGCFLLYVVIAVGGSQLLYRVSPDSRVVGLGLYLCFNLLILPPINGGFTKLFINIARGTDPKLSDLLFGFKRYGVLVSLEFLGLLVFIVGMLPTYIVSNTVVAESAMQVTVILLVLIANVLLLFALLYRYIWVYYIVIDEPAIGLMDALKKSARLSKGQLWKIVVLMLAGFGAVLASLLLLVIPVLIVGPIVTVAAARAYLHLRVLANEPEPPWGAVQSTPQSAEGLSGEPPTRTA